MNAISVKVRFLNEIDVRFKNFFKNMVSSFAFRFLNLAVTIFLVPLSVSALGGDQYAVFAVILAFSIAFTYADLGMGLGIVNRLSDVQFLKKREVVSSVFFTLVVISFTVLAFGASTISLLNFNDWEYRSWMCMVVFGSLGIPLGLSHRILFAKQRIYLSNIWTATSKLCSLAAIALLANAKIEDLWVYVAALLGIPVFINTFLTGYVFNKWPNIRPEIQLVSKTVAIEQVGAGLLFCIVQLAIFFDSGINIIVVSWFNSPDIVREFDIVAKLYLYVPALLSVVLFPLWPSLREALTSGESQFVKKAMKFSLSIVLIVSTVASSLMFFWAREIATMWTGVDIQLDNLTLFGFSAFTLLNSLSMLQSMYLNANGAVAIQAKLALINVFVVFCVKYFAALYLGVGWMLILGTLTYAIKLIVLQRFLIFRVNARVVR